MREEQKEKLKKIILDIEKDPALPKMKEKELMHFLGIPVEEKKAFASLLSEMEEEGVLEGVLLPKRKAAQKSPIRLKGFIPVRRKASVLSVFLKRSWKTSLFRAVRKREPWTVTRFRFRL